MFLVLYIFNWLERKTKKKKKPQHQNENIIFLLHYLQISLIKYVIKMYLGTSISISYFYILFDILFHQLCSLVTNSCERNFQMAR